MPSREKDAMNTMDRIKQILREEITDDEASDDDSALRQKSRKAPLAPLALPNLAQEFMNEFGVKLGEYDQCVDPDRYRIQGRNIFHAC